MNMQGDVPGGQGTGATDTASSAAPGAADGGSGGDTGVKDWTAALDEDTRKTVTDKGWKSPSDVIKSHNDLHSKIGSMISVPGADSSDEDRAKFRKATGVPDTADGYKLEGVKGLTDDQSKAFREYAHDMGYTEAQAMKALSKQAETGKANQAAREAFVKEAGEKAAADLSEAWGANDGDKYKANMHAAEQAVSNIDGLADELKRLGLYDAGTKQFTSAVVMKALSELGTAKYIEGGSHGGGGAGGGDNPFKAGARNWDEIARLTKEDPKRATALAKSAGENPAEWGLPA